MFKNIFINIGDNQISIFLIDKMIFLLIMKYLSNENIGYH